MHEQGTTTKNLTVFADTNLLIHCNDVRHLNYSQIFDDYDTILIYFADPVVREIDKFKTDSSQRRAKKARKYNTLFDEILKTPNTQLTPKENTKITLAFPPNCAVEMLQKHMKGLDESIFDDLLIGNVLAYNEVNPDEDVRLITSDTGVVLKCRNKNIQVIKTPEEWLLPPENDSRDKQIIQLETKLKKMEQSQPIILLEARGLSSADKPISEVQLRLYEELDKDQIYDLVNYIRSKHLPKEDFSDEEKKVREFAETHVKPFWPFNITSEYVAPSAKQIKEYLETHYPNWLLNVRKWLEQIHLRLFYCENKTDISLSLSNTGNAFARNILLNFHLNQGWLFTSEDFTTSDSSIVLPIPKCPSAPKGKIVQREISSISSILNQVSMAVKSAPVSEV
ncbi:MAG: PIN domain-containing protein [Candidatus Cloacimonetes bacterium]|jgi:hypothetical protein|nr:PIN domain-containing protein [Candidatus Cloacimonadota bacterium]